jgi:hypothetical protein
LPGTVHCRVWIKAVAAAKNLETTPSMHKFNYPTSFFHIFVNL